MYLLRTLTMTIFTIKTMRHIDHTLDTNTEEVFNANSLAPNKEKALVAVDTLGTRDLKVCGWKESLSFMRTKNTQC